ncbi:MAG: polysaccharide deacetylase family protein [Armatimonadota bacterium]
MSSLYNARGGASRRERLILTVIIALIVIALVVFLSSCGRRSQSGISRVNRPTSISSPVEPSTDTEKDNAQVDKDEVTSHKKTEAPDVTVTEVNPDNRGVGETAQKHTGTQSVGPAFELKQGQTGGDKIALTFDAGASSRPTPALLKILASKDVRATFFLTGKWVEDNRELTRQIAAAGHEIGNHTYSHPDLRKLTDDEIREQLVKTEELVQSAAGVSTKPLFRAPFGARDSRVLSVARDEGYRSVYWTVDSWDAFKKGITAAEIEERVLDRSQAGSIILMHCGSGPTVEALSEIIDELRAKGYELVTVSELLLNK